MCRPPRTSTKASKLWKKAQKEHMRHIPTSYNHLSEKTKIKIKWNFLKEIELFITLE